MASTWKQSITTSAGIALMNKAYGVSSIIPTKAVTITDNISGYSVTQLMALTSVNYNQSRVPIVVSNQANTTRIGIDIDNKDVNEQYDYYGIGVYFKQVNTGEEVLFSVIPLTGAATIIPNQSGVATSSISIDSYTSIVPGTKVDLSVSDSGSVTRSDVEQIVAANQSYSFPKKPAASGIDFYTLKSVGIYQIKDDKTVVNAPDGFSGNGYIVVIGDGTTANPITQDLFDTVTGNKYSNSYDSDGNKWTGWEKVASMSDVTTAVNTAISNMVDSTPPSLTIADDGTYTITAPATMSTPIVKYFLHYNVDGQSDATKLDVGTKLTGNLKELITKPDKTTTYDVQATAMHANTESGASNSVQFTYVPIDESIYGASWDRKSSSTLTRTDAAVGLKAGINGAQNDFDNVGPWKDMHRVTDSMNNVFVRVPKFYIRKTQTGNSDNGTATWQVSLVSHGDDWYLPKGFWDFTNSKELDYIDIGAYDATGSSSKLTSVAGKAPLVSLSIVNFRSAAKANGIGYQIWDIHANDMLQVLFIIEFATLNSQSIMKGVDNGPSAVNSGAADSHKGSSGTAGSGSSAMSYRGIENLYGNVWQFCDGVNFQSNQPWVCEDATKYQSDLFATSYVKTSYAATSSGSNNYIKALGFDSAHPYAQFSTDDSGSDSTYYADVDYLGSGNTILETGGVWGDGVDDGLFGSGRLNSSTFADTFDGCRLLKKALP